MGLVSGHGKLKTFLLVVFMFFLQAPMCVGSDVFSIEDLEDPDRLYEIMDNVSLEMGSIRGLEVGQEYTAEFMTLPDFAYYRYLQEKEEQDENFSTALNLFFSGYGVNAADMIDPDVAAIAGSRGVAGMYEPEDKHIIITQGSQSMVSFLVDIFQAMMANDEDILKIYSVFVDMVRDEKRLKALSSRQTIFHELVHAGQDWNFDLSWWQDFAYSELDFFMALRALAEGDAVFSSTDYLCRELGLDKVLNEEMFRSFFENEEIKKKKNRDEYELSGRNPLGYFYGTLSWFPYDDGFVFVGFVNSQLGYEGVNDLYAMLPATTRQILHPDRDADGGFDVNVIDWGPSPDVEFESITLDNLIGDEYIALDTTMGELGINALLASFDVFEIEDDPAEGWSGDRLRIYVNEDLDILTLWYLTWETPKAARRFFSSYQEVLKRKCSNSIRTVGASRAPLVDANVCGTQYMDINETTVVLLELPTSVDEDDADLQALVDYANSVSIETMTAAELSELFVQLAEEMPEDEEDEDDEDDEDE